MTAESSAPKTPTVSVVIPAYDEPRFLVEAMRSVLTQSFADLELIVVDDGSPTPLEDAFEEGARGDGRARFVRQSNAGGSAARNRGVQEACGAWIAFLDHDDVWTQDAVAARLGAVDAWQGAEPVLVFGRFVVMGADEPAFPAAAHSGHILDDLLASTLVRTLSVVMVRRDALAADEVWFRADLAISSDVELYYRLAQARPFVFAEATVAAKRQHERNASSDLLGLHREALQIIDELRARMGSELPDRTARLITRRCIRHARGGSSAARREGQRALAIGFARRALRENAASVRSWALLVRALATYPRSAT